MDNPIAEHFIAELPKLLLHIEGTLESELMFELGKHPFSTYTRGVSVLVMSPIS